ncbi:MAG TPA: nitrate reductase subunit beta [Bryobacteraceae bacterium]|nr:nitrate reductase subunit beta [Bryobacteraceae bacterium]
MNVRSQIAMVFHLDKCIGCHTCSLACKNLWTDRPGTEYMWWNNVETKPGTGYPTLYEDQEQYHGGWVLEDGRLRLKLGSQKSELINISFNPRLPTLDDYYHPWTYRYHDLIDAPAGDDQPVARPVSMITGEDIEIEAGPNWDDDLSGSPIYAANDPNLKVLSEEEKRRFFEMQQLVYFYLPRICNHCLNPSCVAACPSGAIYKRGEDGIVLVSQEKCQGWRMCVSGCPYKKVYFNWESGKAEKCILCYPRLETGQAPACMHSCVGKIRYLGVLLYDADRIEETASKPDSELVDAQRDLILDPFDPQVIRAAEENGVDLKVVESAQKSPVYKYVKQWRMALPLHPEWRTLPMLFYVPPLLPVTATLNEQGRYELETDFFSSLESARLPIRYMASLFSAGDESQVVAVYRKLLGVRIYKRAQTVGDISMESARRTIEEAHVTPEEVEDIYHLTALAGFDERMVIPPALREQAIELGIDTQAYQEERGAGFLRWPERGL